MGQWLKGFFSLSQLKKSFGYSFKKQINYKKKYSNINILELVVREFAAVVPYDF